MMTNTNAVFLLIVMFNITSRVMCNTSPPLLHLLGAVDDQEKNDKVDLQMLDEDVSDCKDCYRYAKYCSYWKSRGFCTNFFVKKNCKKTCVQCDDCGRPDVMYSTHVVGGVTAHRGAWPWQVVLQYNNRFTCGGTIIDSRWVLTAAHCVHRKHSAGFKVTAGEHNRWEWEGSEQVVKVDRIYKHPLYKGRLNNDIALLRLKKPVKFGKYVKKACLPSKVMTPGSHCYVTGWGIVKLPYKTAKILQQAVLPVVSNAACANKTKVRITDGMMCTGDGGDTRQSACMGDSGGPFSCLVNGKWEVHGAVSFGPRTCDSKTFYSVFARVYHFMKWIRKTTGIKN